MATKIYLSPFNLSLFPSCDSEIESDPPYKKGKKKKKWGERIPEVKDVISAISHIWWVGVVKWGWFYVVVCFLLGLYGFFGCCGLHNFLSLRPHCSGGAWGKGVSGRGKGGEWAGKMNLDPMMESSRPWRAIIECRLQKWRGIREERKKKRERKQKRRREKREMFCPSCVGSCLARTTARREKKEKGRGQLPSFGPNSSSPPNP